MGDLYIGIAVLAVLALGIFYATLYASRNARRFTLDGFALLTVVSIFAYIEFLWYNARLVHVLPFSNLIILGNWFPLAAAALAGLACRRVPGNVWRKSFSVAALSAAAVCTTVWPLRGEAPQCEDLWTPDGICLQTTPKTCTAACAATLLGRVGIETSEQEMAELCLTREGTTWQGLYRGLKRKTAGTPYDVEVVDCHVNDLFDSLQQPVILTVGLPRNPSNHDRDITAEWGWAPGVGHSVLFLGHSGRGRITIADPTPGIGREEWTHDDLRLLFRGTAFRLVRRDSSRSPSYGFEVIAVRGVPARS